MKLYVRFSKYELLFIVFSLAARPLLAQNQRGPVEAGGRSMTSVHSGGAPAGIGKVSISPAHMRVFAGGSLALSAISDTGASVTDRAAWSVTGSGSVSGRRSYSRRGRRRLHDYGYIRR